MAYTTPRTWAVGDVLTAADMNTYVRDNISYIYGLRNAFELDYAQITTNQSVPTTVTTEGGAQAIVTGASVAYDGGRVRVTFFAPGGGATGGNARIILFRDATVIGRANLPSSSGGSAVYADAFDTPSAASHTYSAKALTDGSNAATVVAGAGGAGNSLPAYLRVERA